MRPCPVCGAENEDFAVLCISCKSYVQGKVHVLHLFSTIWQLVDAPRTAFRKIILAKHKNYVVLLSSLVGMSAVFTLFWFRNLGSSFSNVLVLVGVGILLGPPVGLIVVSGCTYVSRSIARFFGGNVTFRNQFAVLTYACTPVVLSLVIVFPLEIAVFGIDFFGTNPPPMVISPIAYIVLLGLDSLAVLWTLVLVMEGTAVANGFSRFKGAAITLGTLVVAGSLVFLLLWLWEGGGTRSVLV